MAQSNLAKKLAKAIKTGDQLLQDLKALGGELGVKKKPLDDEEKKDA